MYLYRILYSGNLSVEGENSMSLAVILLSVKVVSTNLTTCRERSLGNLAVKLLSRAY